MNGENKKTVCFDPGHGGADAGASYGGLREKDVTLEVVKRTSNILIPIGYHVILTRFEDRYVSLTDRCKIANELNSDIFVSVHCNADPDKDEPGMPEAKGEEIWYYDGSEKGKKLAEFFSPFVNLIFPEEPFRGIKPTKKLYVLKHTSMPAILVELGFIDNSETNQSFQSDETISRIVSLLQLGVMNFFRNEK